jgi:hypothetical protein
MPEFAEELKSARLAKGLKTAKEFFQWLKNRGISCNYSYYMRLEQGGLPSEKVVHEIAFAIKGDWQDRLILAYCRSLFPKNSYLFPAVEWSSHKSGAEVFAKKNQQELTLKQIAVIASSEIHYHLFLLLTLARKSISEKELGSKFSSKEVKQGIRRLIQENLVRETELGFEAISTEIRFPDAYNFELKEAYKKFDLWDETFGTQLAMDLLIDKLLIRRVSGRYLTIIQSQLENLFEVVKSSDELDLRFNDTVLQLKVLLRKGKLPG